MKKRVFVDMDGVLVDFAGALKKVPGDVLEKYHGNLDEVPGLFAIMEPIVGAIDAFNRLCEKYDVHILSTAPWDNPGAWTHKREWVERYLGKNAYKRLTLSHHKNLLNGHFLIDDRTANGAGEFEGKHILFGGEEFPDWTTVLEFLEA